MGIEENTYTLMHNMVCSKKRRRMAHTYTFVHMLCWLTPLLFSKFAKQFSIQIYMRSCVWQEREKCGRGRAWSLFLYHFYSIYLSITSLFPIKINTIIKLPQKKRASIYSRNLSLFNHFHLCYRVSSANTYDQNVFFYLIFFTVVSFSQYTLFHSAWIFFVRKLFLFSTRKKEEHTHTHARMHTHTNTT